MKAVPEITTFTQKDRACIIPYGKWSIPILELLAKWQISILTQEKEVLELMNGKTPVFFVPPILTKTRKKIKQEFDLGLFGNWINPFEEKTAQKFETFLKEATNNTLYVGDFSQIENGLHCKAVFPIQAKPAFHPGIITLLFKEIPVFLPEESRAFFPQDLPIKYYTMDNWKIIYEETLTNLDYLKVKSWADAYSKSKIEKAIEELLKDSHPSKAEISEEDWATFLLLRGESKKGEKIFEKIQKSLSDEGKNNFALCLTALEKAEKAEEILKKTHTKLAKFNLAQLLARDKKTEEAIKCFESFLHSEGDTKGITVWRESNVEAARFQKLPFDHTEREKILAAKAKHDLASLYWEMQRRGESLQLLKDAIALDPNNPILLHRLALLNIEKGMVAQPIKTLNECLKLYPFFFDAAFLLAGFYTQVELLDQATQLVDKYLKFSRNMNPYRSKFLNLRSYICFQQEDPDNALKYMQASLQEEPQQPELPAQLAVIYLKKAVDAFKAGRLDEASELVETSLTHDPTQSYTVNLKGSIAYQRADFDEAMDTFKEVLNMSPDTDIPLKNLQAAEAAKEIQVSIILMSHNDPNHAAMCLRAITEFSDLPYEIIYLRPKDAHPWEFIENTPKMRPYEGDFTGTAQAYNYGATVARGKYFVFMEDDVLMPDNWLSTLVSVLEPEDVGMVGTLTNYCHNKEQMELGRSKEPYEVSSLDNFCMMVKREVLKKIGVFDEEFKVRGYEDRDLCLRAKLAGWKIMCTPKLFLSHAGLLPLLPADAKIEKIDAENLKVFNEKWELYKSKVTAS